MPRCLISFGANIGNSLETIQVAAELLRSRLACPTDTFRLSRFFRTPPVGGPVGQPPFINAVAATQTQLSPLEVWQAIGSVEQELGRQRNRRWEARRIDLDILLYEQERIWTAQIKIPHPRMCMRRFILVPALDVAPEWIDPVSQLSVRELANSLQAGAGSILLVSNQVDVDRILVGEAAQLAMANIVEEGQAIRSSAHSRWVAMNSTDSLRQPCESARQAKLTMYLATKGDKSTADWEAQYQRLAMDLQLLPSTEPPLLATQLLATPFVATPLLANPSNPFGHRPLVGPRYLLAADDRDWAVHEIVSAFEAMDCPIEPL